MPVGRFVAPCCWAEGCRDDQGCLSVGRDGLGARWRRRMGRPTGCRTARWRWGASPPGAAGEKAVGMVGADGWSREPVFGGECDAGPVGLLAVGRCGATRAGLSPGALGRGRRTGWLGLTVGRVAGRLGGSGGATWVSHMVVGRRGGCGQVCRRVLVTGGAGPAGADGWSRGRSVWRLGRGHVGQPHGRRMVRWRWADLPPCAGGGRGRAGRG